MTRPRDLEFLNYTSEITIYPKTNKGREWLTANVGDYAKRRFGESVGIDPASLDTIVTAARSAGLVCKPAKYRGWEAMEILR